MEQVRYRSFDGYKINCLELRRRRRWPKLIQYRLRIGHVGRATVRFFPRSCSSTSGTRFGSSEIRRELTAVSMLV
jgi:hypothetical protein